eukprot:TRINITY_DN505_c1_g1_i1.p1 TRINITY_DN505_c1_g1~~TRINITY_DN505_c1_g1_i1.p1  ORF type:complete len:267 (+),score=67.92 TRINITY_DN505_c1_g1_i1:487-1287(+)
MARRKRKSSNTDSNNTDNNFNQSANTDTGHNESYQSSSTAPPPGMIGPPLKMRRTGKKKRILSAGPTFNIRIDEPVEAEIGNPTAPAAYTPVVSTAPSPYAYPETTVTGPTGYYYDPNQGRQEIADPSVYTTVATGRKKDNNKSRTKRFARRVGGKVWEDPTLSDWEEKDFRIFVGNLGNETNDEILRAAFQKYKSFNRAKVVRDKKTTKTKGFGFVSFLDSGDYVRALREMNGKYIGNRPCRLSRSRWRDRNIKGNQRQKEILEQ